MAIDKFKEVVDRRGYLVTKEDRQIFEKEIRKSNFGLGNSDMIEFVLYDSNDNQLPQGEDAKLVRYIHISDANFNEYFIKSDENPARARTNEAPEFLIDLEKLIQDAGYSNGIFKTQVTLLNRRVGSEEVTSDKLWIHEISPSRTEVRLLPIKNQSPKDLIKRYNLFTEGGDFRDDTIYYANRFIESIDVQRLLEDFLKLKGNIKSGQDYKRLIEKEFGIDFENFLTEIRKEFINSMKYFISDREWDVRKSTYGRTLPNEPVELSVTKILRTADSCFLNAVNKFLPARDIQETNELSKNQQVTFDRVKQILKSASSKLKVKSTIPDEVEGVVRGCTDKNAMNYNPMAKENDGSCKYSGTIVEAIVVEGCMDKTALNYNKYATKSDNSCKYKSKVIPTPIEVDTEEEILPPPPPPIQVEDKTLYVWSKYGKINYTDRNGRKLVVSGKEYDKFEITCLKDGPISFTGDVREVPKIKVIPPKVYAYMVENLTNTRSSNIRTYPKPTQKEPYFRTGGIPPGERYRHLDNPEIDDLQYRGLIKGSNLSFTYNDVVGKIKTSATLGVGERTLVCAQENTIQTIPGIKVTKLGNCGEVGLPVIKTPPPPPKIRGCTDPKAENYNRLAQIDDNSCTYRVIKITPPPPPKTDPIVPDPIIPDVIVQPPAVVEIPPILPTVLPPPTGVSSGGSIAGGSYGGFDEGISGNEFGGNRMLEFGGGNTSPYSQPPAVFTMDFGNTRFR